MDGLNTHRLPMLLTDFYKTGHRPQYPKGTEYVFANWIPRKSRINGITHVVNHGLQRFLIKYLVNYFNEHFFDRERHEVVEEYERFITHTMGAVHAGATHIGELWDMGYLPLEIKALPEGASVPIGVPMISVMNTDKRFFWLTNYIETLISSELWMPMTSATTAKRYRTLLDKWAMETTGSTDGVEFQGHDFSLRGMPGMDAGASSGTGHLLFFNGTDTMPAICDMEEYYGANIETMLVGASVMATEHSVQCANGVGSIEEEISFAHRYITEICPTGICSMVSDTINLWDVITKVLPVIKPDIMERDGKFVIRPDSGDPVRILCGTLGDVRDYTKDCLTFEEFKEWVIQDRLEHIVENTDHGEYGGDETETETYLFLGKYYEAHVDNCQWNRYDKQYYFLDMYDEANLVIEEFTPTPEQIGVVELLWDEFGGTINENGYKVLDSHIGAIYGDSITPERAEAICHHLSKKGFASTNVVFGIGSYTYQYVTRDTFGFAMKTTWVQIKGEEKLVYKDPITDDGTKKSLKGLCVVLVDDNGEYVVKDQLYLEKYLDYDESDHMKTVFLDGMMMNMTTLADIKEQIKK